MVLFSLWTIVSAGALVQFLQSGTRLVNLLPAKSV